jgi:hypothetical protein
MKAEVRPCFQRIFWFPIQKACNRFEEQLGPMGLAPDSPGRGNVHPMYLPTVFSSLRPKSKFMYRSMPAPPFKQKVRGF